MKLAIADREIERHSLSIERKFSIQATAKSFAILSGSLYKDKIRAIIRELSTNAYDGHVAAGCPEKPFYVHLPNALEPFFSVRDEGIGMSHDDLMTIYTTYFQSTKTDSNDFVGALGLGSKSPFSYVDSFTVGSVFDGVSRTYAAFVNETGEPALTLMSELPSLAHNGIEVKLSVKSSYEYWEFRDKALDVLSRFKVSPIVTGCAEFRFHEQDVTISGTGWRGINSIYNKNATAIMGNVAYPIAASAISTLSADARRIFATNLDIDFPIGSLDVTAGREDLSYDKPTLAALERRALDILIEAPVLFKTAIENCNTEYEARNLYGRLCNAGGHAYRILDAKLVAEWRGKKIDTDYFVIDMQDHPEIHVEHYYNRRRKYGRTCYYGANREKCLNVAAYDDVVFVIDDLQKRGVVSRVQEHRRSVSNKGVMVVSGKSETALNAFKACLDGWDFGLVSEFPRPVRKKSTPIRVMELIAAKGYIGKYSISDWDETDVDFSEGGFYVTRRGATVTAIGGGSEPRFSEILSLAQTLGIITKGEPIYGFDSVTTKKIINEEKWIDVRTFVREAVEKMMLDPDTVFLVNARGEIADFERTQYSAVRNRQYFQRVVKKMSVTGSLFQEFVADCERMVLPNSRMHSLETLCNILNIGATRTSEKQSLSARWMRLQDAYPFLNQTASGISEQHVADYIVWCDLENAKKASITP